MSLTTRVSLVGTAALAIAGTAFGGGSDNDALAQIAELKQELAELKSQNSESWLTEQRAEEVRGIVQDVLADAETRTSLQDSGAMAGWNNGFFLSSADGNYKLNISGLVQAQWFMNDAKKGADGVVLIGTTNDRNTEWGFQNGYTLLNFAGNVVDPSWTYRLRVNLTQNNPAVSSVLDFAFIKKTMDNGLNFTMGQFRAPWMREVLVEDGHQLAVTRSMLATLFGQGFSQGFQVGYAADDWNVNAMYSDGIGDNLAGVNGTTGIAPFANMPSSQNSAWNATQTKWSLAARGEYKLKGAWADFEDESSFRGEDFGMLFGAAFMAQNFYQANHGAGAAGNPGGTQYGLTADVTASFGGWSISGAGTWVHTKSNNEQLPAGVDQSTNPWGVNIQGGYFVTDEWELFGRYEYIDYNALTTNTNTDATKYNGVTIGANWFMAKHNAKFTIDWSFNLNSFGNNITNATLNSVGWRQDAFSNAAMTETEKHQWALRAQMQLMF
jgi:hypothetical protein